MTVIMHAQRERAQRKLLSGGPLVANQTPAGIDSGSRTELRNRAGERSRPTTCNRAAAARVYGTITERELGGTAAAGG